MFKLLLALLLGVESLWMGVVVHADSDAANWEVADSQLRSRVDLLIEQLGSSEFARREQAAAELRGLGLSAFDALHRAQAHEDAEIRLQAQHLVRSLQISWTRPDDSEPVKQLLRRYENLNETLRSSCISRLAELEGHMGIEPLCRLVRFEPSDILSKRAALRILQHQLPDQPDERARLLAGIRRTIGASERPAGEWVRTYGRWLLEPDETINTWNALIKAEERRIETEEGRIEPDAGHAGPDQLAPEGPLFWMRGSRNPAREEQDRELFGDLLRWYVDLLRDLHRDPEAEGMMRRLVALTEDSRASLLEMVDWLIDRRAWPLVNELVEKYPDRFRDDALLLYRQAEALLKQDRPRQAEEVVLRALDLNKTEPGEHVVAAVSLERRGLLDWSIREYRHVMRQAEPGSLDDLNARLMLAELLHDQAQDEEAAVVLQGAVEQMETNPVVLHRMGQQLEREPASVKSRMHYFFAESFRAQANLEKQREHLRQGVADDPKDADVLIAMYRLQRADPAWRQQTRDLIRKAAEEFRGEIEAYDELETRADSEALRAAIQFRLATLHNQLAWLIGNTEGDYQRALESSQQSLKYRPDTAGYLDTLARCYYALKDHENAVKYQRRATELEPHSGQIRRQLTLFEEAFRAGGED